MPFDKNELLKLSTLLDAKAATAEAQAAEHEKHAEKDQAALELKRAKSARHFAKVCRDAHEQLKKTRIPTKTRAGEYSAAFTEFWNAYPKKAGKGDAGRAWIAMRCEGIADKIIPAVERAKQSRDWQKDNGDFIPHPGTWLRREGWEDSHEQPQLLRKTDQDPPRWREFLKSIGQPYREHKFAQSFLKDDFIKWKR
jgi:hypothetical protein